MIVEQHYLGCLAQASYFVADPAAGVAAVVDPRRDVELYLERARETGCEIRHVFLTHFHADFVSGHLELAERTGAAIHLGARASAEFPFEPMRDGEGLELGALRLEFLETPGHTPESCCIVLYGPDAPDTPHAVFTGDTLFVGDVGRPDLMASVGVTAEELASALYDSTREKLLTLPDETIVYPGHGAGSMCGKNLSSETTSTIGAQRATNPSLQEMTRVEFVARTTAEQPPAPQYFAFDAGLNRRRRATLAEVLERGLRPLSLQEVLEAAARGAVVLDSRDADAFAAGHLAGSFHAGLSGKFATWVGTLLAPETPLVVVADEGRERETITRLGRIGYERVEGYLEGGGAALESRPELLARFERVAPRALAEELSGPEPPVVLDVRARSEREAGAIPGSLHVPLPELDARWREVPAGGRVVVVCAGGYRSAIGVGLLERHGVRGATDLVGGMGAWNELHAPAS